MEADWSATETRAEGESERSERQRCSRMASGGSISPGEKAALPRQRTANARGDVWKPSQAGLVGRVRNTWVFAFGYAPTGDKVLYPLQARQVYSALVCRKIRVYPGRAVPLKAGCRLPNGRGK